ncbi:hypothetical protein RHGRI_023595 [Rhododendron griersonianum]|uniref:O-methyltransferase C-terminal domain-containing protein n=1 Tax=Rhododendron griersonianum TaxID=479676 RepID=A0AAV6J8L7_9ERIC|nr:hypothetical protein RHGRI_023595 [Rhododendron griersonianum]
MVVWVLSSNGEGTLMAGDFLDDVLEEESDKIFFDNNTSSFQSEIDWESPPRFDEYADDEFEICETNVIEDIVHVAIQEDGIIGKIIDGSGETKFMSLDSIMYINTDPKFHNVLITAMAGQSNVVMGKILEVYKGFDGLRSLVDDVGGGIGKNPI